MTARQRILSLRLLESQEKNSSYMSNIGIEVRILDQDEEKDKNE